MVACAAIALHSACGCLGIPDSDSAFAVVALGDAGEGMLRPSPGGIALPRAPGVHGLYRKPGLVFDDPPVGALRPDDLAGVRLACDPPSPRLDPVEHPVHLDTSIAFAAQELPD